jgi:hypothetical protein
MVKKKMGPSFPQVRAKASEKKLSAKSEFLASHLRQSLEGRALQFPPVPHDRKTSVIRSESGSLILVRPKEKGVGRG